MCSIFPIGNGHVICVNPRPGGGLLGPPPSGFSRIAKNGGVQRRLFVHFFVSAILSATILIFSPAHIMSGHQVRWGDPTSQKRLWCYSSCSFWAINMKLSGYDKTISSYKTFILDFYFVYLRPDQFCDLPIIRQREKSRIPHTRVKSGSFIMTWVISGYCLWYKCKFWSVTFLEVISGQPRSPTRFC